MVNIWIWIKYELVGAKDIDGLKLKWNIVPDTFWNDNNKLCVHWIADAKDHKTEQA